MTLHAKTLRKLAQIFFEIEADFLSPIQGCAQEVISGGKFPRGIKSRGQPCACVRRTYLAGGWGCGEKAGIITGIIKLLLWSRSTGHYLGIIGRILEEY